MSLATAVKYRGELQQAAEIRFNWRQLDPFINFLVEILEILSADILAA